MANVEQGNIFECTWFCTFAGQRLLTVMHYAITIVPADPTYNIVQDDFSVHLMAAGGFTDALKGCLNNSATVDFLRVQMVHPRQVLRDFAINLAGTAGATSNAPNVAAVITKRTAHAGNHTKGVITNRGGVGSIHVGALPADAMDNGLITIPYAGLLGVLAIKSVQEVTLNGGGKAVPCLWHKKATFPPDYDRYTHFYIQPQVRIMRRRTVGLGI